MKSRISDQNSDNNSGVQIFEVEGLCATEKFEVTVTASKIDPAHSDGREINVAMIEMMNGIEERALIADRFL